MRTLFQCVCLSHDVAAVSLCAVAAEGSVCISEILDDNETGIQDEDGDREDWIELYNSDLEPACVNGWWLTDKASNTTEWQLPNVTLAAKGTLLIWASGKNRTNPKNPLHANFNLTKGVEYLGLYKPDPSSGLPVLVDAFSPGFPALPPDVSYGRMFAQTSTTFVASGEVGRYRVPASALQYTGTVYTAGQMGHGQPGGWNVSQAFDDSTWTNAATGVGYDTKGGLEAYIGTDPSGNCLKTLQNINTSLCFRRTFYVPDPSNTVSVKPRMKFEDAFVAFINGTEVGRTNYTGSLAYNAKSGVTLNVADVTTWAEYTVPNQVLVAGTNLLAVQGLNITLGSSDFLLLPEVVGVAPEVSSTPVYFSAPTPSARNGFGTAGPLLYGAAPEDPNVPRPLGNASSPPLVVTVNVVKTQFAVSSVRAVYGPMWNAESNTVALLDDGVVPDATAGDGVYSASLQTTNVLAGQMFRWRFVATDASDAVTRLELTDVCGENILDFEYKDGWYPASDGTGRSLVLRDTNTAHNAFGNAVTWGLCGSTNGSPGSADASHAQAYRGWDNFHFTETEREDDLVSGPFADPDDDGRVNWVEYALGCDPQVSDAETVGFSLVGQGDPRRAVLSFRRPAGALDVTYELLATGHLVDEAWGVIATPVLEVSPLTDDMESVMFREGNDATASSRFYRLRLNYKE